MSKRSQSHWIHESLTDLVELDILLGVDVILKGKYSKGQQERGFVDRPALAIAVAVRVSLPCDQMRSATDDAKYRIAIPPSLARLPSMLKKDVEAYHPTK